MIPKTLTVTKNPILALTESEYLLLKMATQPKNSSAYYINASNRYFNRTVFRATFNLGTSYWYGYYYFDVKNKNSPVSEYILTPKGMEIAMAAAKKIGLTLTWSIQ
jgi:hypothetical protein